MDKKILNFPNQTLPELDLSKAGITPEYIQQITELWEAQPPDENYTLILQAEAEGDGN